jgi:hypothetical protein
MVMAVDACEENLLEKGMGPNARQIQIDKLKKNKTVDTSPDIGKGKEITSEKKPTKPNQPGSGVKKEIGTDIGNKLKGAIGKVKQQVEKNPAGFMLQNP